MYTPHVVTVFNVWEDSNLAIQTNITILRGVFLDTSRGNSVSQAGLSDTSRAILFIPHNVRAEGITGVLKRYKPPKEFAAATNKASLWTLESGGDGNSTATYFARGVIKTPMTLAQLKANRDDVFDVTSIAIRDFGSEKMRHWMVNGR